MVGVEGEARLLRMKFNWLYYSGFERKANRKGERDIGKGMRPDHRKHLD